MHRNPAPQLMIRTYSRELISDKGWQLSNYACSDNRYGLGFCVTAWTKWLHYWYLCILTHWYLCMLIHLLMHTGLIMFAYIAT
jgi:hypothetical protein